MVLLSTLLGAAVGGLTGWVIGIMERLGAVGAGIAVFLENVFPPIPSEVILPLAGITAARGGMSLVGAIVATTLGSLAGALLIYGVGYVVGRDRLRAIIERMPLVDVADADKAEGWFNRHGNSSVLFGRMIPGIRSFISLPAGFERMPLWRFCAFTTLGSGLWNTLFILGGFRLGERWDTLVTPSVGYIEKGVIALIVLAVVYYIGKRIWISRQPHAGDM